MYLSLFIFSLSICAVYNFCYVEELLSNFPFLFIIAKSFIFLVAPCGFLYIRNVFRPESVFRKYDWIHFTPFVIVMLILTNMSLRNPEALQRALADSAINWYIDVTHAELYYSLEICKCLLWLFYTILQSWYIIDFERRRDTRSSHLNYRLLNWVKIFNITLIVLFGSLFIQRIINVTFISIDFVNDTTMSFILLLTLFFLVFNPHILYSLQPLGLDLAEDNQYYHIKEKVVRDEITVVKPLFSTKKKDEYLLMLDDVLTQQQPYLHKGITVKKLAEQTRIPAHHLSSLISSEFNLHFQDFINLKRIEYLKDHIEDISWKQLTLEGICWEVGFTSRTTFFRAFIKFTGISPSEYFNTLKKNNHSA